jgi:hypothetical protein
MPAPALWWWHMEQALSVQDGVERALQIMDVVPAPRHKLPPGTRHDVTSDEDRARLITDDFRVIVKCLPRDRARVLTIIIAAGNDDQQTEGVMRTFRDVMQSGDIRGLLE